MTHTLEPLRWRYAVKRYDPARKISAETLALIEAAIQLSPSSHGLQPYKVLVICDEALRARLREASYDQPQITDASHLLVFAVDTCIDEAYVDSYFEHMCRERQVKLEGGLLKLRNSVASAMARMSSDERLAWATNQAYLALGNMLSTAAQLGVDANPMEGFIAARYNELLSLQPRQLTSVVIAGLGHRHPEDPFQRFKKVRRPLEQLVIRY